MCRIHTVVDGASPTCLSERVSLANRTAEADVHETLGVNRQRCATREHEPDTPTQQGSGLTED